MLDSMSWLTRLGFVADSSGRQADAAALLAKAIRGDQAALSLLYRRESGAVYRYALALCGDEAAALDAMQEAFTQLLQQPQGFDATRGALGAYLAGIARHQLLRRFREAKRFVAQIEGEEEDGDGSAAAPASDSLLVRAEAGEQLWSAIRRLPWSQREALVLVDLQERAYQEAADVAGVSVDVLRTRLHRARQRLATLLGAQGDLP
jgi:RNA polymerase sigma-70 factor (ECF subfamily)